MKVLILDGYFLPEQIAFTHLEMDLIKCLVDHGHDVEIVCPTPTRGVSKEVVEEYKNRKEEYMYNGHVHITRFWAPQENSNPFKRALRYLWCNLRTYQIGIRKKDIDTIFSDSTPPTQGLIAGLVKNKLNKRKKGKYVRFVYDLCDVFPDSLVNSRLTTQGSMLYRIGRRIENTTYKNSDKIIAVSESNLINIINKGVNKDKCCIIPDWIDTDITMPVPQAENDLYKRFNIDSGKFTVVYAGNMGEAQGVDVIIDCAEMLSDEDIQFVLFGGGARYPSIVESISEKKLHNVIIHDLLPLRDVSKVYSLGDIALITCKKGTGMAGMPSKTWSIMACNTYIVASFDCESELAAILRESDGGITVQPEDPLQLKDAIYSEYIQWSKTGRKKSNSRDYVQKTRSKNMCVGRLLKIIEGTE